MLTEESVWPEAMMSRFMSPKTPMGHLNAMDEPQQAKHPLKISESKINRVAATRIKILRPRIHRSSLSTAANSPDKKRRYQK